MEDLSKALKSVKKKKMVSLKKQKTNKKMLTSEESETEQYSYGTRLDFGTEEIEKMGMNLKDLKVGSEVVFLAKARINSISQRESMHQDEKQQVEMQITDIALS